MMGYFDEKRLLKGKGGGEDPVSIIIDDARVENEAGREGRRRHGDEWGTWIRR